MQYTLRPNFIDEREKGILTTFITLFLLFWQGWFVALPFLDLCAILEQTPPFQFTMLSIVGRSNSLSSSFKLLQPTTLACSSRLWWQAEKWVAAVTLYLWPLAYTPPLHHLPRTSSSNQFHPRSLLVQVLMCCRCVWHFVIVKSRVPVECFRREGFCLRYRQIWTSR